MVARKHGEREYTFLAWRGSVVLQEIARQLIDSRKLCEVSSVCSRRLKHKPYLLPNTEGIT